VIVGNVSPARSFRPRPVSRGRFCLERPLPHGLNATLGHVSSSWNQSTARSWVAGWDPAHSHLRFALAPLALQRGSSMVCDLLSVTGIMLQCGVRVSDADTPVPRPVRRLVGVFFPSPHRPVVAQAAHRRARSATASRAGRAPNAPIRAGRTSRYGAKYGQIRQQQKTATISILGVGGVSDFMPACLDGPATRPHRGRRCAPPRRLLPGRNSIPGYRQRGSMD
jgi:hypothetical protein